MAALKIALLSAFFACTSLVQAEVEDLHPLLQKTEEDLQKAKTHVEHMLNLSPLPNEEKLHSLLKNESAHLACEMKKWATKLHTSVQTGEHQAQVKEAVTAAHTHLNEAASTLEHVEGNLKEANSKYFAAAEKMLHEIKTNVELKPCDRVTPVLKHALYELKHDFNNYQFGMHELVGSHEGEPKDIDHHHGVGHDHEEHKHEGHDHEGHDHEGHDHEGHDHEGHAHEGHNHEGHNHGDHQQEGPHHHKQHGVRGAFRVKFRSQGVNCDDSHSKEDSSSSEESHSHKHH